LHADRQLLRRSNGVPVIADGRFDQCAARPCAARGRLSGDAL